MSKALKKIGKVFKKVIKVVKKVAPIALAVGAVVFTGGAALGVLPTFGSAISGLVGSVGISGTLGSALTGAITKAGFGAAIGGALGGKKGMQMGALSGALLGGAMGAMNPASTPLGFAEKMADARLESASGAGGGVQGLGGGSIIENGTKSLIDGGVDTIGKAAGQTVQTVGNLTQDAGKGIFGLGKIDAGTGAMLGPVIGGIGQALLSGKEYNPYAEARKNYDGTKFSGLGDTYSGNPLPEEKYANQLGGGRYTYDTNLKKIVYERNA